MSTIRIKLAGHYTLDDPETIADVILTITTVDGTVKGAGADKSGPYTITGLLIGDDLRFIKFYTNPEQNLIWKYIGTREPSNSADEFKFIGGWGETTAETALGKWELGGYSKGIGMHLNFLFSFAINENVLDLAYRTGNYRYSLDWRVQEGPMYISLSVDNSIATTDGSVPLNGVGLDDYGTFSYIGTVTPNNVLNFRKRYTNGKDSGRYDGFFTPTGAWGGIWVGETGEWKGQGGSFLQVCTEEYPEHVLAKLAPLKAALNADDSADGTLSSEAPTIESAIAAVAAKQKLVPEDILKGLLSTFSK
ncbi:hypothetical protein DL93DRAFT_2085447 [Clavulina sp. PMI_390]|nr:hypothetical protein DL93DRAFT_2085447 [Clavulina sp. PMI_390]